MRIPLSTLILATLLTFPGMISSSSGNCPQWQEEMGTCEIDNDGTDLTIDGTHETDGTDGTDRTDSGDWEDPADPESPRTPIDLDRCLVNREWDRHCFTRSDEDEVEDDDPGTPSVTITDLVRFTPVGSTLTGEPDNVGLVGLPTNFVTTARTQTVAGELLGFPLSVRFTPATYDFVYGDGSHARSSSGGAPWANLAQAQFTPTDTSHTYRGRGTYTAHVEVQYTAEVNFGTGWFPVAGHVTSTGAPQEIRIFEAHTALVAFTCAEAPRSPGC